MLNTPSRIRHHFAPAALNPQIRYYNRSRVERLARAGHSSKNRVFCSPQNHPSRRRSPPTPSRAMHELESRAGRCVAFNYLVAARARRSHLPHLRSVAAPGVSIVQTTRSSPSADRNTALNGPKSAVPHNAVFIIASFSSGVRFAAGIRDSSSPLLTWWVPPLHSSAAFVRWSARHRGSRRAIPFRWRWPLACECAEATDRANRTGPLSLPIPPAAAQESFHFMFRPPGTSISERSLNPHIPRARNWTSVPLTHPHHESAKRDHRFAPAFGGIRHYGRQIASRAGGSR